MTYCYEALTGHYWFLCVAKISATLTPPLLCLLLILDSLSLSMCYEEQWVSKKIQEKRVTNVEWHLCNLLVTP